MTRAILASAEESAACDADDSKDHGLLYIAERAEGGGRHVLFLKSDGSLDWMRDPLLLGKPARQCVLTREEVIDAYKAMIGGRGGLPQLRPLFSIPEVESLLTAGLDSGGVQKGRTELLKLLASDEHEKWRGKTFGAPRDVLDSRCMEYNRWQEVDME